MAESTACRSIVVGWQPSASARIATGASLVSSCRRAEPCGTSAETESVAPWIFADNSHYVTMMSLLQRMHEQHFPAACGGTGGTRSRKSGLSRGWMPCSCNNKSDMSTLLPARFEPVPREVCLWHRPLLPNALQPLRGRLGRWSRTPPPIGRR